MAEAKRRRLENEEKSMYDEFGRLKKKFREWAGQTSQGGGCPGPAERGSCAGGLRSLFIVRVSQHLNHLLPNL